jgi:lipoate-protein ligase B
VTLHGFALNINPDLSYFDHIVACGLPNKGATSITKETGISFTIPEIMPTFLSSLSESWGVKWESLEKVDPTWNNFVENYLAAGENETM